MTDNDPVMEIIKRLDPNFPIEQLIELAGGRRWRIPYEVPIDYGQIRQQILADPCREVRTVTRRYKVSREFVYRVWRAA